MTSHHEYVQVLGAYLMEQPRDDAETTMKCGGRVLTGAQAIGAAGYCIDAPEEIPAGGMAAFGHWWRGKQQTVQRC